MLIYLRNVKVFRLVTWNLWDSNKFYRTYLSHQQEHGTECSVATEEIEDRASEQDFEIKLDNDYPGGADVFQIEELSELDGDLRAEIEAF